MNIQNQVSKGLFWIGDTSIFIALCASSAVLASYSTFAIKIDWHVVVFVTAATLFTYNLQRRLGPLSKPESFRQTKSVLMIVGAVGMVFSISSLSLVQIFLYASMGLLSFLYAQPFFPLNRKILPLRNIPFVKLWVIVLVWVLSTYALPLFSVFIDIGTSGWVLFFSQQFFFIAALTIPFDIRDMHSDDPFQKTLPMIVGVKKSMQLAIVFCTISLGSVVVNYFLGNLPLEIAGAYGLSLSITFYVLKFGPKSSRLYHIIYVDGLILLQGLLIFSLC